MSQQIEYAIFQTSDGDRLTDIVMARILEGWRPIGGVAVNTSIGHDNYGYTYTQAMIREKRT